MAHYTLTHNFFFEGAIFNLKNILHGSRGFINQLTKQIFLCKELPTKLNENNFSNLELLDLISSISCLKSSDSKSNRLIGTVKKRKLFDFKLKIIKYEFKLDSNEALIGVKLFAKGKTYHSKMYSRKANCNSYTISYLTNNEKCYGEIDYILEINSDIYACINKFSLELNLRDFSPKSYGFFYDIVNNNIDRYFKLVMFSNEIEIIKIDCILNKCIVINNNGHLILSELVYEFEHD